MSKRKIIFWVIAVLALAGGVFGILSGYGWFLKKQARVLAGTASPRFPYADYNLDELNNLYPQYIEVATTQTPEETYAKFIACLKKEDVDCAVEWVAAKNKENYRTGIKKALSDGKLDDILKEIDKPIKLPEDGSAGNFQFYVIDGREGSITFVKDLQGVFRIESL